MTSPALNNIFAYLGVNTEVLPRNRIMHGEEFIADNIVKVGYA